VLFRRSPRANWIDFELRRACYGRLSSVAYQKGLAMNDSNSGESPTTPLAQYPSGMDDTVLYNVPDDTIHFMRIWFAFARERDIRIVKTVSDPPPLFEEEGYAAEEAGYECVKAYFEKIGRSNLDELNVEIFAGINFVCKGGEDVGRAVDRTLEFPLMDPEVFTKDFITNLQTSYLAQRPLWRMLVVPSPGEDPLTIYPDAVRLGDVLCPPADLDQTISAWKERVLRQRAPKLAAEEKEIRQFRYLKRVVPQLVGRLKETPLIFAAVFEDSGEYEGYEYSVATLVNEPSRDYYAIAPERTSSSRNYPVFEDGSIGEYGGHWGHSPFRLLQWSLPKVESPTLVVAEGHDYTSDDVGVIPGGRQWSLQITPETVITHAELERLEAGGELD